MARKKFNFTGMSADEIYAEGMYNLYDEAGRHRDYDKALIFLQKAHEMGHAEASYELGVLAAAGPLIMAEENIQEAIKFYTYAAENGSKRAKKKLADLKPLIKPWMSEDRDKALSAVREETDPKRLAKAAKEAPLGEVRRAAVEMLDKSPLLADVARHSADDPRIGVYALKKVCQKKYLKKNEIEDIVLWILYNAPYADFEEILAELAFLPEDVLAKFKIKHAVYYKDELVDADYIMRRIHKGGFL